LHEERYGCTTNAIDLAARNGHIEVVKFLHYNRTEGGTAHAIDYASKRGHYKIVQFLLEKRDEGFESISNAQGFTQAGYDGAINSRNLEVLELLSQNMHMKRER
jgi:ankyrin repeat protein